MDLDEIYASIERLEAIRMVLAFSCIMIFKLFQMGIKSVFLNGDIMEKMYVDQPPDFRNPFSPNHVFKLKNTIYNPKQTLRTKHDRPCKFMLENNFQKKKVDKNLYQEI